jgi:hypothetical protein
MDDSFFVICDSRMNAVEHAARGEFQLLIGFAATRAREFHSFRISLSLSGSRIVPASLNRLNSGPYSPEELEWVERLASQLRP